MVLSIKNVNILGFIEGRGDCLKGRGLGQFADLRGRSFGKKEGGGGGDVFEQGG